MAIQRLGLTGSLMAGHHWFGTLGSNVRWASHLAQSVDRFGSIWILQRLSAICMHSTNGDDPIMLSEMQEIGGLPPRLQVRWLTKRLLEMSSKIRGTGGIRSTVLEEGMCERLASAEKNTPLPDLQPNTLCTRSTCAL